MPEVIDWRRAGKTATIRRAVRALAEGQLVAFPTETTYSVAASALVPDAVARLQESSSAPFTLAMRDAADALDWIPSMSALGRRLARRCWPGPVELIWPEGDTGGLMQRLAEPVRQSVCAGGDVALRAPGHPSFLLSLRRMGGPILFRGARSEGEQEAVTADSTLQGEGHNVACIIDDGPTRYRQAATAIRITGNSWEVVREGIVSRDLIARLSSCLILFVCTGNTCRSPMAEALCKRLLSDRLGCTPEELPQRGYLVQSAGLSAAPGGPAADEAVRVAQEFGADLSSHASQPVSADLVAQADHLFAMTEGHLRLLMRHFPSTGCKPRLLSPEGDDVPDPIGSSQEVYRECARQIASHLERFLPEVQAS